MSNTQNPYKAERAFKGIWIPKDIWLNKSISIMEKLFLIEIDSLDNDSGCFASNKYFSDFFDVSKGRCTQIIKSLESKGYLSISHEYEGKQIKKRIIKVVNLLNRGSEKIKQGYLENDEDNNTSINNTLVNNTLLTTSEKLGVPFIALDDVSLMIIEVYQEIWGTPHRNVFRNDYEWCFLENDNESKTFIIEYMAYEKRLYLINGNEEHKNRCTLDYIETIQERFK